ncbi:hypothetical protein CQY20_28205 [Mycolicibacterium agri]|uniref:DUF2867 domain-containing protein n=1 Tax=Mycolicibacterium agri TaxID=36811 RepID=A0A2A7MQU7_MYCAG|nr:DUF2867 domain-containing protein [Mycolicibacterium agri]PEG33939.1 hypothetical protein CQY20_28205 [Mycolicibacterium agri]GFG48711.1 hypothetical protein MAGR_01520 [Mycolicibacterium agri]
MKLPKSEHFSRPWRIHELARDFRLEDVWALPTPGGPDDFPRLVRTATSFEARRRPSLVGLLFAIRLGLGRVLGWDRPSKDDTRQRLRERLPGELRARPSTVSPALGFDPLFQLHDEWAAEIVNRTVHGVIHLGWVPDGEGGYRGQMAILVKPKGLFGEAYMLAISPFRYLIVYPRMLERIGQQWFSYSADRS